MLHEAEVWKAEVGAWWGKAIMNLPAQSSQFNVEDKPSRQARARGSIFYSRTV